MNIEIHTHQVDLVEALRAYVEQCMRFKLDRHASHIRRLELRFTEERTAKDGMKTVCTMTARLLSSGELQLRETNSDLYQRRRATKNTGKASI